MYGLNFAGTCLDHSLCGDFFLPQQKALNGTSLNHKPLTLPQQAHFMPLFLGTISKG